MSNNIRFDYTKAEKFLSQREMESMRFAVMNAKDRLLSGQGEGSDFQGWIDLPVNYDKDEFERIKAAAKKIQSDSDVLIVIGIGGSYLGARAAIEYLRHGFYNEMEKEDRKTPQIYYVGNSMSSNYLQDVIDVMGDKDFSINVISKSGTTTESAIAFRIFRKLLVQKYGEAEAAKRIYSTTDKARGALKTMSDEKGYECFVIPDDVGGRFSVLTAVGLLPIAVSGADIDQLMEGAAKGRELAMNTAYEENASLLYAAARNVFYRKGKNIEILANYEPSMHYIAEWWKQLFGESEGKDQRGIFPASVDLTTDLHSMGQYIQDGLSMKFETVLNIEKSRTTIILEAEENDLDGLNYIANKELDYVNKCAMQGTIAAHTEGGVPNLMVHIPEQNEFYLGELFYFFEFDQPGVEFYKKNMFKLLGKPGYEK